MKKIYILTLILGVITLSACKDDYAIHEKQEKILKNQKDELYKPVKNPIKWDK